MRTTARLRSPARIVVDEMPVVDVRPSHTVLVDLESKAADEVERPSRRSRKRATFPVFGRLHQHEMGRRREGLGAKARCRC